MGWRGYSGVAVPNLLDDICIKQMSGEPGMRNLVVCKVRANVTFMIIVGANAYL